MFNISQFLEKFKNITPPDKFVKEIFISVVKDTSGIALEAGDLDVRNGVIFISTNPIVKNEIFLKKREILQNLSKELKQYKKDIRNIV